MIGFWNLNQIWLRIDFVVLSFILCQKICTDAILRNLVQEKPSGWLIIALSSLFELMPKYVFRHSVFRNHPPQSLLPFIRRCSAIRYSMFEFYMIYTCNIQIFFVICYYSWNLKDISYCRHNNKTTILQHWEHVLCTTNAFWIMMESCFLVN